VRDYLLAAQAADASRLFLIEPESVAAAGAPKPRVTFALQLAEGGPAPTEKPFAPPPPSPSEKGGAKSEKGGAEREEFHFRHPGLAPHSSSPATRQTPGQ
jgi:hypothetical protein